MSARPNALDLRCMRLALELARRGYGRTAPNPMVGAVLARGGRIIGRGWHRRAGLPHAEVEAIADARRRGQTPRRATLYVTLEPCSTCGRTAPCTEAIQAAGIRRVVVAATDPNPAHRGRAFRILRRAGLEVQIGLLREEARRINEAFNHWIVRRTPWITLKAALTLDGKIATASGQSKWITGTRARAAALRLRQGSAAVLVGVNTILADNPRLTARSSRGRPFPNQPRRIVLDPRARTLLSAHVVSDRRARQTVVVVGKNASPPRVRRLAGRVIVWQAPLRRKTLDLKWLLRKLGSESIVSLLVEGGGETHAAFLAQHLAHRIAFFYAPKVLGGRSARKAVGGAGARRPSQVTELEEIEWQRIGQDLQLTARTKNG